MPTVNGQQDLLVGGHQISTFTDSRYPCGRTLDLRVGLGEWCDPLPFGGFGEAVGASVGEDDVGVVE